MTVVASLTNYAQTHDTNAARYQAAARWALSKIMRDRFLNTGERMTFLATAVAADIALASAGGYNGHTANQIAAVTGVSPSTARSHHRALVKRGFLMETTHVGNLVVRVPEVAFQ